MPSPVEVFASSFEPLRSRTAEWDARLAMIRRAKRFLYSSTYYVGPDTVGHDVLAALGDAAERGVRCTLVVDWFGQWLGASAWGPTETRRVDGWFAEAEARGVQVVWTSPTTWTRRLVGGGHHVKIQLCESGPALFASSNLSHHSFESWGEFSALLDGPVVETFLAALQAVIPDSQPERLDPRPLGDDPLRFEWWWFDPSADPTPFAPLRRGLANPITDGLIRSIDAARRSVSISSFYVKPEANLRAAILGAARRGVVVEVFHSGPDALGGMESSWLAAALDYPALLGAGVAVHEVAGGEHSKLVLVDDSLAIFGSYNLDNAAHDVVTEAMLATEDARVVSAVATVFADLRVDPGSQRIRHPRADWRWKRRAHAVAVRVLRRWL